MTSKRGNVVANGSLKFLRMLFSSRVAQVSKRSQTRTSIGP